ncbi:hypothetical protein HYV50_00680 [Candidatus Pacearchaeota archaeon]|nr:hypothetical protein [Candidatus Pacearchaeota archaeon]
MDKKLFLIVLFVGIVLLNISNTMALGIAPGRSTFDYSPGEQKKVDFTIVNTDKRDLSLVIFTQGEFNNSIALSEVFVKMSANEESKTLSYTFTMPSVLSPGLHKGEIVVLQLPEKSGSSETFVGATVGVITQLYVYVPYPGKYAESELDVIGPENDGKITFVMPVTSRGELDIARVRGTIDIYSVLNEKVATLTTNEIPLASKQRAEIAAVWEPKVAPGPYRAVATVLYDEQTLTVEKKFNVGKKSLVVEGIEVNDFSLGEIAKFEVLIKNEWSDEIQGAYSEIIVYNQEGKVMATFKSPTYDIPPLEKSLMVSFWDTEGVRKGTYESSLFLKYGDSADRKDLKFEIADKSIKIIGAGYVIEEIARGDNTVKILIGVIVFLILINLSWFIFLRKKFVKK